MIAWAIAAPTMYFAMPLVRRALTRIIEEPWFMHRLSRGNLLAGLTAGGEAELVEVLARGRGVRIERIVSTGQASPPGFWYDQPQDEFVVVLAGSAVLRFEDGDRRFDLKPGDWIEIPARARHRVEFTQADPPTVWLAVHGGFTAARAGA
jgi:cupin 2 domain-containing protein